MSSIHVILVSPQSQLDFGFFTSLSLELGLGLGGQGLGLGFDNIKKSKLCLKAIIKGFPYNDGRQINI